MILLRAQWCWRIARFALAGALSVALSTVEGTPDPAAESARIEELSYDVQQQMFTVRGAVSPQGTKKVAVSVSYSGTQLLREEARVEFGVFSWKSGTLEKEPVPGVYSVRIVVLQEASAPPTAADPVVLAEQTLQLGSSADAEEARKRIRATLLAMIEDRREAYRMLDAWGRLTLEKAVRAKARGSQDWQSSGRQAHLVAWQRFSDGMWTPAQLECVEAFERHRQKILATPYPAVEQNIEILDNSLKKLFTAYDIQVKEALEAGSTEQAAAAPLVDRRLLRADIRACAERLYAAFEEKMADWGAPEPAPESTPGNQSRE